jgi:type VI secretion system secreted protein VgrG
MPDLFTVSSPALPPGHRVIGFRGMERLSRPYELSIDLLIGRDLELDLETVLGERLTLTVDRADERPPMQWHGVIADAELVHELSEAGIYTLSLVPAVWQLSLAHHSRIFVDETTPTIIAKVLQENDIETSDYELRLTATYKKLEHVCQYEETDLAFLSRWMEREGIYYFFEQGEEREKLIVTDNRAHHHELLPGAIRYVPQAGAGGSFTAGEALHAIVVKHARLPASVKLEDYDYQRPDLEVSGNADIAPHGLGEVRLYGENFTTPDEGKRLAMVRAQALSARKRVFHANGTALHLRPGYTFVLDEHPRPAFNTKYLTTALEHIGNQAAHAMGVQDLLGYESDAVYRCKLAAIPATVQFRPDRATPAPRVDGVVSAVIDGPADSPYAQIDKQGRYKIRVKFDEGEPADGKGSMHVRMLQPHGGSSEGFHFPLRKGTEVMLLFLGGDPDQPIIAGVVPNAHKPSVVTGENHTKNVIQTGGKNRIEMEDADGSQHAHISTPTANTFIHMGAPRGGHHLIAKTDGSSLFHVLGRSDNFIFEDENSTIDGNVNETYKKKHTTTVTKDRISSVHGNRFLTIHKEDTLAVIQAASADYGDDFTTHVGGIVVETYDKDHITSVSGETKRTSDQKETITVAERKEVITGNCTQNIGGNSYQTISGDSFITILGKKHETYSDKSNWTLGTSFKGTLANVTEINLSMKETLKLANELELSQSAKMTIGIGLDIKLTQSLSVQMKQSPHIDQMNVELKKSMTSVENHVMKIIG